MNSARESIRNVYREYSGMKKNLNVAYHNLFFSALPAPVPLYFDGVTLNL